ncbi:primosomal protein N' [Acinetobacter rathckeae]|uniref:primosomal protein N' n=1 Tax=Acinetobacter rathckeae TaxID=2605272 RepID=UPI0018A2DEF6|nr:primosomal protein N' [Acinetobacter rathckeae]MBF7696026.1 primosomal protein N' [Acinetobacter rathckeae]
MNNPLPFRIRVAVPVPIHEYFDYEVSAQQYADIQAGMRVTVPFGRQTCVAIVIEKVALDVPPSTQFKLKKIIQILDEQPLIDPHILQLLTWSAQYYMYPLGEVIQSALPTRLRQGHHYDCVTTQWQLTPLAHEENTLKQLKRSEKQRLAVEYIQTHPHGVLETELNLHGISTATLKALEKKQLVQQNEVQIDFSRKPVGLAEKQLTANTEQLQALEQIVPTLQNYAGYLLDGITGSGKTEVYLQVMWQVLKQNKQVLVLVPEIGLTPQTIARFRARFDCHIALLHSGLNDTKRLHAWQQAQTGQAGIILGTRSALYTPIPDLGLIILDEEHDLSFKQQEGFRYHARDVALYRGYLAKCPVILGSATPSIDSFALAKQGKLKHIMLNQRAGHARMPKMQILDLKIAPKQHGLSLILIEKIKATLQQGQQVLVFLNRRGYAPVLMCESCAWQANCPRCDAHFTLHTQPYQHLHCHHCGLIQTLPKQCPACQHPILKPIGLGTVKIEEGLKELFPEHDVLRVDKDSTRHVGSLEKIYAQIHAEKPLILLGTQMLAKGHHFPHVSLVAILDIDAGLLSVDFRAPERTAQLITQVAGRAGRGDYHGEVILQTLRPEHPILHTLLEHGYRTFAEQTLKERETACLPPYRYSILIRSDAKNEQHNLAFLSQNAKLLTDNAQQSVDVWGPIPAPMQRKAGKYHAHMLLLASSRVQLHHYVKHWWQYVRATAPSDIRLSIDVDPQEFG